MRIELTFEDDVLRAYARRGSSPFFGVWLEHDGEQYPGKGWTDFGANIIGWWIVALAQVIRGAEHDVFEFMDGPYSINIYQGRYQGELVLRASDPAIEWYVSSHELASALKTAASEVVKKLSQLELAHDHQQSLNYGIALITRLMRENDTNST